MMYLTATNTYLTLQVGTHHNEDEEKDRPLPQSRYIAQLKGVIKQLHRAATDITTQFKLETESTQEVEEQQKMTSRETTDDISKSIMEATTKVSTATNYLITWENGPIKQDNGPPPQEGHHMGMPPVAKQAKGPHSNQWKHNKPCKYYKIGR